MKLAGTDVEHEADQSVKLILGQRDLNIVVDLVLRVAHILQKNSLRLKLR